MPTRELLESGDLLLQVSRHEPTIFLLQRLVPPVLAGNHFAARRGIATALQLVVIVICSCPVVSQFLTGLNIPHGDKDDLTFNADVGIAGMVAEDHAPFALLGSERPDEEILSNLNFSRTQLCGELRQFVPSKDMPTFNTDNLPRL